MISLELEARLDNLLATAQEETADIDLFAPLPEREECAICMIPLPLEEDEIKFMTCCGKTLCIGCSYKQSMNNIEKSINDIHINGVKTNEKKCAFCCQPPPKNIIRAMKKLMKKNNPGVIMQMATRYREGNGVIQSNTKTLELRIRAAELGYAQAFGFIGHYYEEGFVVEQNTSKALEFYGIAAKRGSVQAHNALVSLHAKNGNADESTKHLKVAASAGDKMSMDDLMQAYKVKLLSKEELTQTLRAFQTSTNEMKSEERDEARLLEKR